MQNINIQSKLKPQPLTAKVVLLLTLSLLCGFSPLVSGQHLKDSGASQGSRSATSPGPLSQRFEESLQAIESFVMPSVSPSGREDYPAKTLKAFHERLDRLAYQVFYQFESSAIQTQLWQMYFDPKYHNYATESDWVADASVSVQEMAVASYIPLEFGSNHKLTLSPHLRNAPTWSRIYRLIALIQLGHEHQFIAETGAHSDYGYYYAPLKAANLVYTAFVKQLILAEAPYAVLSHEAEGIASLWASKGLAELLDLAKTMSDREMWAFFLRPLRLSFGLKDQQITELFNKSLLKFLGKQNQSLPWPQTEAYWLKHHQQRLNELNLTHEPNAFSQLKSLHQHSQHVSSDFLMTKALRQLACRELLIISKN